MLLPQLLALLLLPLFLLLLPKTQPLLPWAARGELNASVMDFTPNYICDADAMARSERD